VGSHIVLVVKTDALSAIDNDPVGWWQKTKNVAMGRRQELPTTYGFGSFGGYFSVASLEHDNTGQIIAIVDGYPHVLVAYPQSQSREGDFFYERQSLALLREAARKLGYRLQRMTDSQICEEIEYNQRWVASEKIDKIVNWLKYVIRTKFRV
jgi:hypothetical protein